MKRPFRKLNHSVKHLLHDLTFMCTEYEDGRIDIRDIGKSEADAIIQYALFGEIYYD